MASLRFAYKPSDALATIRSCSDLIHKLTNELELSSTVVAHLVSAYWPVCRWIADQSRGRNHPPVIGINGAQGSGKSTFCRVAETLLSQQLGIRACGLSIDDFYLTRGDRNRLAEEIHPLLATRGVPGTHDVDLALETLDILCHAKAESALQIPVFSKAMDDRLPTDNWRVFAGRPDVVILEGWCVGITPQSEGELIRPGNRLEREEDRDKTWRRHVNRCLEGAYAGLFSRLDALVFLQVPNLEHVGIWRRLQEEKLARRNPDAPELMNAPAIARFVEHYERLTRHALATLPGVADIVCRIDSRHRIVEIASRENLLDATEGGAASI